MKYLHKLFFFNPNKQGKKLELYIAAESIDFMTWHKRETSEGTTLHCNIKVPEKMNHIVDGLPENVNQISFDGLFFKGTAHYAAGDQGMKKYSAWINPENISLIYVGQPDSTIVYFQSGVLITLAAKAPELMKNLLEHNKKLKERRKQKYGKQA